MYRYSVDNAVTYTSEDFVLFRESPFACWMERLTLENPDHGIPPDVGSIAPENIMERQDDIVDTLRSEGRDVTLIEWDLAEPRRRTETLEAMRGGADFVVNGQLALGPLSGSANLLMRTSGYSELGDFLYVPCDTQAKTTLHSAFRLCFLVDLLHSLQGQLPPQMLIIRGGSDVLPLQSEDHIYHYRAVKQRFMEAMRNFRKHRMPNPAESSHFGRWSDCAHEVLKQRALRAEQQGLEMLEEDFEMPLLQAAGAARESASTYDLDDIGRPSVSLAGPDRARVVAVEVDAGAASTSNCAVEPGNTLAEQARMITPETYRAGLVGARPGSTPNLTAAIRADGAPKQADQASAGATRPTHNRRSTDVALQNLEFIGSSHRAPLIGLEEPTVAPPVASPPAQRQVAAPLAGHQVKSHPLDSAGFNVSEQSIVDMDAAPAPSLHPAPVNPDAEFDAVLIDDSSYGEVDYLGESFGEVDENDKYEEANRMRSFSDSLITSDDYQH